METCSQVHQKPYSIDSNKSILFRGKQWKDNSVHFNAINIQVYFMLSIRCLTFSIFIEEECSIPERVFVDIGIDGLKIT